MIGGSSAVDDFEIGWLLQDWRLSSLLLMVLLLFLVSRYWLSRRIAWLRALRRLSVERTLRLALGRVPNLRRRWGRKLLGRAGVAMTPFEVAPGARRWWPRRRAARR